MNRYSLFTFCTLVCMSATQLHAQDTVYKSYGQPVSAVKSKSLDQLLSSVSDSATFYKIEAVVDQVCQKKGCWLTLKEESGAEVIVTFKNYEFFVPSDAQGKRVIISGMAKSERVDKDLAQHYADDAGIAYEPNEQKSITFIADGVLLEVD